MPALTVLSVDMMCLGVIPYTMMSEFGWYRGLIPSLLLGADFFMQLALHPRMTKAIATSIVSRISRPSLYGIP